MNILLLIIICAMFPMVGAAILCGYALLLAGGFVERLICRTHFFRE